MAIEIDKIKDELLNLPAETRAWLAQTLIESLDKEIDLDVDIKWQKEIARRDNEITTGQVSCKPIDEVMKKAKEKLQCSK